MKTLFSILAIASVTMCYSQNLNNSNVAIQQQSFQNKTIINTDNNIGNFNQSLSNPVARGNTFGGGGPNVANVQQRSSRGNRSQRSRSNEQVRLLDNNVNDNQTTVVQTDNNKQVKNIEKPQVNLNLNVEIPTIKLNTTKIKEEKAAPKKLDDFRIKTGGNSSSGNTSHKTTKKKKTFTKKIVKPLKCWWQKNFKGNVKFQFSCECFKF